MADEPQKDPLGLFTKKSEDTVATSEVYQEKDPLGLFKDKPPVATDEGEMFPGHVKGPEKSVTIFSSLKSQRAEINRIRDNHTAAWAQNMKDVDEGKTADNIYSPYSLKQSYTSSAGFDNSLMGLTYEILSGQSLSKGFQGGELYDWESYDPSVMEEVGAIAFGFMIDAPLFALGGGMGGFIGKKAATLAVKPVLQRASKVLLKELVTKKVPMELAESMIKFGMGKNAKILGYMARGTMKAGQTLGSSAGALGLYNAMAETLGQMAHEDKSLLEVEARDVLHEGLIGIEMGLALGALGMGGKYLESIVKLPGAHQLINTSLGLGVKGAVTGGEVALFAAGDAFIRDEPLTKESWYDAMKMVAGAKLSHKAKGLFIKPEKAKGGKAQYDMEFSGLERDVLEKYRPEGYEGEIGKGIKEDRMIEIMADEKLPWVTKAKLIYQETGFYPEAYPDIKKIEIKSTKGDHKLFAYTDDNMLIDARKFTSKVEAEITAKVFMDKIVDVDRRNMLDDMTLLQRKDLFGAMHEKGMDLGKTLDAWDTHPEFRNGEQSKLVNKFYDTWDQWVAGEVEKVPEAKPKGKPETGEIGGKRKVEAPPELADKVTRLKELNKEIKAFENEAVVDEGQKAVMVDERDKLGKEIDQYYEKQRADEQKTRSELGEPIKLTEAAKVDEIKGGYQVHDNISGDRVKVKSVEDVDRFSGESKDLIDKIDKELERRKGLTMDESAPYAIGPKTYTSQVAFLKQLRNTPPDHHKDVASDIRYPKDEAKLVFDAMEEAKEKFNYTEIEPSIPWVSEESLRTMREILTSRSARLEEIRGKLLEPKEIVTPDIKSERESLLAGVSDVIRTSISPKQELQKAINAGKKMTKEENKNIREKLTQYLADNRQRFNRLKIPVKTHIMRDINKISIGKWGWGQVDRLVTKLERLMEDKEYRDEIRAREGYITRLQKEVALEAVTRTTGQGKGRRKAKLQYMMAGERGGQFMDIIGGIRDNIEIGLSHPELAIPAIKELEKIQATALKRREMKVAGIFEEELRKIEEKEGILDMDGFTEQNYRDMEMLQYLGIDKLHSRDVKELLDQVKFIKKDGRLLSEMLRDDWKVETVRRKAVVLEAILPKGKELIATGPQRKDRKGRFGLITGDMSLKSLLNTMESLRELKPGEIAKFRKGPLSKEILPIVERAENGMSADRLRFAAEKKQAQYELLGVKNYVQLKNKLLEWIVQKPTTIEYTDANGKRQVLAMSQAEALHQWLTSQQEGAMNTFMLPIKEGGMGWTAESFAQLEKYLKPELKAYGEWMRDRMGAYEREHVAPVYLEENGVRLSLIEKYWPFFREAGEFNKSATDLLDRSNFRVRATSDHHIERTNSTSPFVYMDAFQVFDRYMDDQAHYKNFTKAVRVMDETFKDKDIRAAISQYHGKSYVDTIDWFIDRLAGKEMSQSWGWFENRIKAVSKGILYLNRAVGLKQLISTMMYLTDMDLAHWGSGLTRMLMTGEGYEMRKYLIKQPFTRDRGNAPYDMDTNVIRTRDHYIYTENKLKASGQRMRYNLNRALNVLPTDQAGKVLGSNIKYGDRFPIINGGGAYVFDLIRRDGKTFKQIKAEATREAKNKNTSYEQEFDRLMEPYIEQWASSSESTQQSTRISNISKLRASSTLGRSFAMFTSGAGQIHRVTTAAMLNAYNSVRQGNTRSFLDNMRAAFISHALMGAAFNLVGNGFLLDPEEKWLRNRMVWGVALGNAKGLFAVGRALAVAEAFAIKSPWAGKSSMVPVFDTFKQAVDNLNRGIAVQEEISSLDLSEAPEELLIKRNEFFAKASMSFGQLFNVQAKQGFALYEDVVTDVAGGEAIHPVRQLLGIYNPEYNTGVRLVDTFDPDEWEKSREEAKWLEGARRAGLSHEEIQEQRKERYGK